MPRRYRLPGAARTRRSSSGCTSQKAKPCSSPWRAAASAALASRSPLASFKDDYDRNQPMWRILPEFCAAHPTYERLGLRDLCQSIHEMYAKHDVARLVTEMYLSDLHPAMKPSDAYARIAHRDTERVTSRRSRAASRPAADAVPAGHSAADPGRALQQEDRRLPALHARLQRPLPRLRHRRARPGRATRTAATTSTACALWPNRGLSEPHRRSHIMANKIRTEADRKATPAAQGAPGRHLHVRARPEGQPRARLAHPHQEEPRQAPQEGRLMAPLAALAAAAERGHRPPAVERPGGG